MPARKYTRHDLRDAAEKYKNWGKWGPNDEIGTLNFTSPADIIGLTVPISTIAATVAMQGGNTFQTNMFSTVKTALDVAVMRLESIPGIRSEK